MTRKEIIIIVAILATVIIPYVYLIVRVVAHAAWQSYIKNMSQFRDEENKE